jgi:hypothetical protein
VLAASSGFPSALRLRRSRAGTAARERQKSCARIVRMILMETAFSLVVQDAFSGSMEIVVVERADRSSRG